MNGIYFNLRSNLKQNISVQTNSEHSKSNVNISQSTVKRFVHV